MAKKYCRFCNRGGECAFPYHGTVDSSDPEKWPENFKPDQNALHPSWQWPITGTFTHCLNCGADRNTEEETSLEKAAEACLAWLVRRFESLKRWYSQKLEKKP